MTQRADQVIDIAYRIARFLAWCGGGLILIAALIVAFDVAIRKLFSVTVGGAEEIAGYSLAIGSALGFGFALFERAHIRIDSIYVRLPTRVKVVFDLLSMLAVLAFFFLVARYAYNVFNQSVVSDAHSLSWLGTPMAVPQFVWLVGLVFFVLTALLLLLRSVLALATGDLHTFFQLIGPKSAVEDLEQQIDNARSDPQKAGTK